MKGMWAVMKRELRFYFTAPYAYVVTAVFIAIMSFLFWASFLYFSQVSFQALQFSQGLGTFTVTEHVFRPLFENMRFILLIMIPMFTMRLLAEERRTGTLELLLTYPLRDGEIIFGKFFAVLATVAFMLLFTVGYLLIALLWAKPEWGVVGTAYLGVLLMCAAFVSLGLWASSLTDNQMAAVAVTFGSLLFFWLAGWVSQFQPGSWQAILPYLSITEHFKDFAKGTVNSADVTFYLAFTGFFLFLTFRSLEARNWKGTR